MLLVIDNFDSFTYNLVQYFGELGVEQKVFRNDEISGAEALALQPDKVLLSPGPCSPNEAGNSLQILDAFAGTGIPLFGVCLGHQCIGQYFGGKVIRASRLMHGKTSPIEHGGKGLFQDLPQAFAATRYHSLIVEKASLPDCLEITAETREGEIMGFQHRELPIHGVQFHPESMATEYGMQLLGNFLSVSAVQTL
jgi:anthranilate synthase/aminodeoxychorismate synthase-like glutamine amidotransferase